MVRRSRLRRGAGRRDLHRLEFNRRAGLATVDKILSKAKMTPALKAAMLELRDAIRRGDDDAAYELSSVKSFITGSLETSGRNHFGEDNDYNRKILGGSVYSLIDNLHFKLAMKADKIPSGMMVLSSRGVGRSPVITQKGISRKKSPTLTLIRKEDAAIRKEAGEMKL